MKLATLFKVECHFDFEDENETSVWHCGSLEGARRFIEKQKSKGLLWYSIQGQDYIPCDENDPYGQLYIGLTHFEFKEKQDWE